MTHLRLTGCVDTPESSFDGLYDEVSCASLLPTSQTTCAKCNDRKGNKIRTAAGGRVNVRLLQSRTKLFHKGSSASTWEAFRSSLMWTWSAGCSVDGSSASKARIWYEEYKPAKDGMDVKVEASKVAF